MMTKRLNNPNHYTFCIKISSKKNRTLLTKSDNSSRRLDVSPNYIPKASVHLNALVLIFDYVFNIWQNSKLDHDF